MDSGVTNHAAFDLNQLNIGKVFDGIEKLQLVMDKSTRAILLQGDLKGGLYQLNIPSTQSAYKQPSSSTFIAIANSESENNLFDSGCISRTILPYQCSSNTTSSQLVHRMISLISLSLKSLLHLLLIQIML